jgi:hypothetical protein
MIRAIIIIISVLYVIGGSERIVAQAPHFSIFDSFKKIPANGEGAVIVHQSDEVKQLVGTRIDNENVDVINV